MTGWLPSFLGLRAIASLLLAVVALQATPAQPLPLVRDEGPAFCASSTEVAVAVRRVQLAEVRAQAQPDPLPPPPPPTIRLVPAERAVSSRRPSVIERPAPVRALEVRPATPARAPPPA